MYEEQMLPSSPPSETTEYEHDTPLVFEPSDSYYPRPYPPDHPARLYLEELATVHLTQDEVEALKKYEGNDWSSKINASLAEGDPIREVREIDEAMAKSRLPRTTIVYRGDSQELPDLEDIEVGSVFERIGYTSTSLDSTIARSWHNSLTVLRIEVPKDTPVAVPSLLEAEILLPHGAKFEVVGAREIEGQNQVKYVEISARLITFE